jgi:hypothetical protein
MGETVDDHDFRVVGVGGSGRFDEAVRTVGNADDVVCATRQSWENGRPIGWERWLLFDDASLALCLVGLGRCELAGLHELADVSGVC